MWLQTFGLDSVDDIYTPKCSDEIKKALQGRDIRLTKGSLLKLAQKDRLQYIPQIKQTLDNPDIIIHHDENDIFILHILKPKNSVKLASKMFDFLEIDTKFDTKTMPNIKRLRKKRV